MSLKNIAERCGISTSTVSRILNNSSPSCASAELKDRVWQVARELGYTPNQHARGLKKGSTEASPRIAVLLARTQQLTEDPFFSELYRSTEIELFAHACRPVNCIRVSEFLADSSLSADGLIVLGRCPAEQLQQLHERSANIVCVTRNPLDFPADAVVCSGAKAARVALEYLMELGHRKIAYIGDCSYEQRYVGYCETLIDHQLPLDYRAVFPTGQTEAEGEAAMQQLLQQEDISAVLCANDATAIGALKALNAAPQRRISLISIDNIEAAQFTQPLLSTVNIPRADMAHLAVHILLDRIRGGHKEFIRLELPCRIIKRESCHRVE